MVGSLIANIPYLPKFRSLAPPHGLEEAPIVHQPGPDHLDEGSGLYGWLSRGQYDLPAQFQVSRALPWPRTGTCCPPTWP